MRRMWVIAVVTGLVGAGFLAGPSAQPLPVDYAVHLASATNYDTRSRDEDTIHASISVFVNGAHKETAIWDGRGWDGSRAEGRKWVPGLHVFGPGGTSGVQVATGRLQDSDTVQIVYQLLNAGGDNGPPTPANHQVAADRIARSMCSGSADASAWDCLAPQAAVILDGWPMAGCDGLVAADKVEFTAMQLRRRTETGDAITLTRNYRASDAPPRCGFSIYGAIVTIARR